MKHPIPGDALDDRLGFIGTSGSGKTYNSGTAIEMLLARRARVVIVDPLGAWWGLRLLADGKTPSGFNVVIFGGDHADLPLNEQAGTLLGETVATMAESCIIDLSKLPNRSAERRFMVAFLETLYRKAAGHPFHLVVDEADLFAPQKPQKGDEVLLGHMDNIVRRGRLRGFIPWLISQRPAVLNKNVLSQVDGLLAFKLTASQDRDALDAWIEGQADKAQGKEIKDSLPTFKVGEGLVWLPGHGILERKPFPQKGTFDSSRKPKRGEKIKSHKLKPLDVGKLEQQIAAVVEQVKATDVPTLQKRIRELEAVAKKASTSPAADPLAIVAAEERGFNQARTKLTGEMERELHRRTVAWLTGIGERIGPLMTFLAEEAKAAKAQKLAFKIDFTPSGLQSMKQAAVDAPKRELGASPGNARKSPAAPAGAGDIPALGAERRPLMALAAVHPAGMTEAQWAVAAGLKRKGGTWSTYLSRLRTAACIEKSGEEYFATDLGLHALGDTVPTLPPPGPELVGFWKSKLSGVGPMLDALTGHYPAAITREELAAEIGLAAGGGTFSTYISRLRSPGLVEVNGQQIRLAPALMGDAA